MDIAFWYGALLGFVVGGIMGALAMQVLMSGRDGGSPPAGDNAG